MYNNLLTWETLRDAIENYGSQITSIIEQGKVKYDKWAEIVGAKTDEQILALPQFNTMTQDELTDLKAAMTILEQMNDALYGLQALGAYNRHIDLLPFI
jgi:hypothetical protein